MNVNDLIAEVEDRVRPGAPFGTRFRAEGRVEGADGWHHVVVSARIDPKGQRREVMRCDGFRVERALLLRLTCPEHECPQARAVREQWRRFHDQRAGRPPRPDAHAPRANALIEETPLVVDGYRCVARPAPFTVYMRCPNAAHPPLTMTKTGYDLFEDGLFVGGGIATGPKGPYPRLPSLSAAEAYVRARAIEARAVVAGAAEPEG